MQGRVPRDLAFRFLSTYLEDEMIHQSERLALLTQDVYAFVYEMFDNEVELDGIDASKIAQKAADAVQSKYLDIVGE